MSDKYLNFLEIISENLSNEDSEFVKNNKDLISKKLSELSFYLNNFIEVSSNQSLSKKEKIKSIQNISSKSKNEIPAKNNTAITKAPITSVDPRSGWDIINSPKRAKTTKGLKKPNEVLMSLSLLTQ